MNFRVIYSFLQQIFIEHLQCIRHIVTEVSLSTNPVVLPSKDNHNPTISAVTLV